MRNVTDRMRAGKVKGERGERREGKEKFLADLMRREARAEVRKVFDTFREKGLTFRLWGLDEQFGKEVGQAFRRMVLEAWGVPPVFAETAVSAPADFTKIDQEIAGLGDLKSYFPPRTESQPTLPRALVDYRESFSHDPADYDLLVLLAGSDPNLEITLWLRGDGEEMGVVRNKVYAYARSRYGLEIQKNLKFIATEEPPEKIFPTFYALFNQGKFHSRGKVTTGFLSANESIFHQANVAPGLTLVKGIPKNFLLQNLGDVVLARHLLDSRKLAASYHQIPHVSQLAEEGHWEAFAALLKARSEARQAMLAAA